MEIRAYVCLCMCYHSFTNMLVEIWKQRDVLCTKLHVILSPTLSLSFCVSLNHFFIQKSYNISSCNKNIEMFRKCVQHASRCTFRGGYSKCADVQLHYAILAIVDESIDREDRDRTRLHSFTFLRAVLQ